MAALTEHFGIRAVGPGRGNLVVRVAATFLVALIVSGCAGAARSEDGVGRVEGSEVTLPRSAVDQIVMLAVNQTGATNIDEAVWVAWAVRACREGATDDPEVAAELASEFAGDVLGVDPDPGLRENLEAMMKVNGLVACRAGAGSDQGGGSAEP